MVPNFSHQYASFAGDLQYMQQPYGEGGGAVRFWTFNLFERSAVTAPPQLSFGEGKGRAT